MNDLTKDKGYSAFDYVEALNICLLTSNWNLFFEKATHYQQHKHQRTYLNVFEIHSVLLGELRKNMKSVTNKIINDSLKKKEHDLIFLYLHIVEHGSENYEYDDLLKKFKRSYHSTQYNDFVQHFLPKKNTNASFAWGLGINSVHFSGKLQDSFKSALLFNMSIDFNINKIYTSFNLSGGSVKVNTPFYVVSNLGQFQFIDDVSYLETGGKLGYYLVRKDNYKMSPFVNLSNTLIKSNFYSNPEDENQEIELINSFTYGLGVHSELLLFKFTPKQNLYFYNPNSYIGLKINFAYNFIDKTDPFFDGNVFNAQLGIVWGIGNF